MLLAGVRRDGHLEAAESSPTVLSALHQHSQPQLSVASDATDGGM